MIIGVSCVLVSAIEISCVPPPRASAGVSKEKKFVRRGARALAKRNPGDRNLVAPVLARCAFGESLICRPDGPSER